MLVYCNVCFDVFFVVLESLSHDPRACPKGLILIAETAFIKYCVLLHCLLVVLLLFMIDDLLGNYCSFSIFFLFSLILHGESESFPRRERNPNHEMTFKSCGKRSNRKRTWKDTWNG